MLQQTQKITHTKKSIENKKITFLENVKKIKNIQINSVKNTMIPKIKQVKNF